MTESEMPMRPIVDYRQPKYPQRPNVGIMERRPSAGSAHDPVFFPPMRQESYDQHPEPIPGPSSYYSNNPYSRPSRKVSNDSNNPDVVGPSGYSSSSPPPNQSRRPNVDFRARQGSVPINYQQQQQENSSDAVRTRQFSDGYPEQSRPYFSDPRFSGPRTRKASADSQMEYIESSSNTRMGNIRPRKTSADANINPNAKYMQQQGGGLNTESTSFDYSSRQRKDSLDHQEGPPMGYQRSRTGSMERNIQSSRYNNNEFNPQGGSGAAPMTARPQPGGGNAGMYNNNSPRRPSQKSPPQPINQRPRYPDEMFLASQRSPPKPGQINRPVQYLSDQDQGSRPQLVRSEGRRPSLEYGSDSSNRRPSDDPSTTSSSSYRGGGGYRSDASDSQIRPARTKTPNPGEYRKTPTNASGSVGSASSGSADYYRQKPSQNRLVQDSKKVDELGEFLQNVLADCEDFLDEMKKD